MRLNIAGQLHSERRMVFTQVNQACIVPPHLPVVGFAQPVKLIDSITCIVTIVVATFRAQHLLTALEKGYTLRGQDHCLGKLVHPDTIRLGVIRVTQCDLVPQGVVIMACHIVDGFPWGGGEIVDAAFHSSLDFIHKSSCTCCEPSPTSVKDASTKGIADMVVEDGQAQSFLLSFG